MRDRFTLHLLCEATAKTWVVFFLFDIKTRWIRIETTTPMASPQSAALVSSQAHIHVQACPQRQRERERRRAHGALSSQDNKHDWSKSPEQSWPVATARQLLLLLMSETKRRRRVSAPLITPGRRDHCVFVIVCRRGSSRSSNCENNHLSRRQTSARFCLLSLDIHLLIFPLWGTKRVDGTEKSGWYRKKWLFIKVFQSCWFSYTGALLILLLRGFNFDASLTFTHSTRDMKHFPFAFFPPVLWTTAGIWTAALLERGKRWWVSPLTALAECDLVFSSLWGRRGCYLTVQQRNLGCHFARHQQRPRADSVSRVRSQVQPESSAGREDMVMRCHSGRKLQNSIQTDLHWL